VLLGRGPGLVPIIESSPVERQSALPRCAAGQSRVLHPELLTQGLHPCRSEWWLQAVERPSGLLACSVGSSPNTALGLTEPFCGNSNHHSPMPPSLKSWDQAICAEGEGALLSTHYLTIVGPKHYRTKRPLIRDYGILEAQADQSFLLPGHQTTTTNTRPPDSTRATP
jgi:hypothetical protein